MLEGCWSIYESKGDNFILIGPISYLEGSKILGVRVNIDLIKTLLNIYFSKDFSLTKMF